MNNNRNPHEPLLKWFETVDANEDTAFILAHYYNLAKTVTKSIPRSPERTMALRKLLESRDAIIRSIDPRSEI